MDALAERLAELLQRAQHALGLNQRELARLANISEGQMSGIATGHKPLRKETFERLRSVTPPPLIPDLEEIYRLSRGEGEQVLLHARDVAAVADTSTKEIGAHVIGLITQRYKKSDRLDWTLTDETGSVPIVVQNAVLDTPFEIARGKLRGDRVDVRGFLGKNPRGSTSIIATRIADPSPNANKALPGGSEAAAGIYIARLTAHFRTRLIADGYLEIATKLLSSSWPVTGLYPLKALYDGFGQPFYIAPSPLPQLVKSLIETRYEKIFTVSRCFTQTYRDPTASVESAIISTATTQGSIESALSMCHSMVERLYLAAETAPRQERPATLVVRRGEWPPGETQAVSSPEVQLYEVAGPDGTRLVGRLLWPQLRAAGEDFQEYVLAEGFSQAKTGESLTCFTINIERLLALLFAEVDIRRIPTMAGSS